jgi:hypothetical protein
MIFDADDRIATLKPMTASAPNLVFEPELALTALLVQTTVAAAKRAFSDLYEADAVGIGLEYDQFLGAAARSGLVENAERPFVTAEGQRQLDRIFPASVRPREMPARDFARVLAAARLLETKVSASTLSQLKDVGTMTACLAAKLHAPERFRGLMATKSQTRIACMRAVAEHCLSKFLGEGGVQHAESYRLPIDPIVLDLFRHETGLPDCTPEDGFAALLRPWLKTTLIGSPQARWSAILVSAAGERMLAKTSTLIQPAQFMAALQDATRLAASQSPSGWLTIAEAYDKYRAKRDITFGEFKAKLADAALDGDIELSPVNMASSLPDKIRERSETTVGGRIFHFLRIPRRRNVS